MPGHHTIEAAARSLLTSESRLIRSGLHETLLHSASPPPDLRLAQSSIRNSAKDRSDRLKEEEVNVAACHLFPPLMSPIEIGLILSFAKPRSITLVLYTYSSSPASAKPQPVDTEWNKSNPAISHQIKKLEVGSQP
jgi:hypothetical protein